MMVIVIHELDYSDKERDVIGVAESPEKAEEIIKEYYRDFEEISFTDIREGNLEYSKVIEVEDHRKEKYKVEITLEWFQLNKC